MLKKTLGLRLGAGVVVSMSLFGLIHCAQKPVSTAEKNMELGKWQHKMLVLSNSMSKLMPLVSSVRAFNDPKNFSTVDKETRNLAGMAHEVNVTKMKPSGDPSLQFVSGKFAQDMNEAVKQLDLGNRKYARFLVKNATSYCISCHTRNDQGRQNMNLSLNVDLSNFAPIDRVEYHIAVRDFDAALNDFDKLVNSADAQIESPQAMEIAAEKILAVAVRVKREPSLANELVSRIMDAKWSPIYLKLNATAWKQAIKEWEKEPKRKSKTSKQMMSEAKNLMGRGWKFTAQNPQSRAGIVYFLRASTELHDILGMGKTDSAYGEALYYAGLAAESLREINLWTLHEAYYEACIRHQPYTQLARKCYLRYEALQLSAYSSYEGSFVPAHVRDQLRELKALAQKDETEFLDWGFAE